MATTARRKRSASEPVRTGTSVEALKRAFIDNLCYIQGKFPVVATRHDHYMALAQTVRDRLLERWIRTGLAYFTTRARTVCYLSAEFLLGPQLGANLLNLGLTHRVRAALYELGLDLDELLDEEEEPGLGNGGLGRLAACYLDSLATLEIPSLGYGIRYEFGIFDQEIRDGWQVEVTDKWLRLGNPWEIPRPEIALPVKLGGKTLRYRDAEGRDRVRWEPHRLVLGVAYDTPVLGYEVETANLLRLWKAEACESFDFEAFNLGDYYGAVGEKVASENITKVLYPNDSLAGGKKLRLEQQYFFVSCSLQDMIRIHLQTAEGLDDFHEKYAVQLNDTHPALAVPELMRLLVDEHGMDWERAWDITRQSFGYTNHTLLLEALETWSVALFSELLPRHLEIVYEINRRFLDEVRGRYPGDEARVRRLSLIDEGGGRSVRMANLASVGSHAINGVAALHTELLKLDVLRDFYELWPEKFSNKTNGVTPRRFVALANPGLARVVTSRIGDGWIRDLAQLRGLEPLADDPELQQEMERVKLDNKKTLAELVQARTGVTVDPESLYDVQVKRIHEYKRQHLNVLHVITRYLELKRDPSSPAVPRTILFAGKAAPGYFMAKLIVKLIHGVAEVVNADRETADRLRVAFLPDFNVKLAERIYPAADLSEQISTAGKEASGTGNMKFALNGALTIGTLDGANVEIRDEVGTENFFLFGLTAPEVRELMQRGYRPRDFYDADVHLREAVDAVAGGRFSRGDRDLFRPLVDGLLEADPFLVLADYRAYIDAQRDVDRAFADRGRWTRMALLNVARMGKFSSDRAIREYCEDIWHAQPVSVVRGAPPSRRRSSKRK